MSSKYWLLGALCALLVAWFLYSQEKPPRPQDIIKFSHKYHQVEFGTACADCHVQALESTQASDNLLPVMTDCATCHDVESEDNCTLCHFEDESTWMPFAVEPTDLIFNHKFHMEDAGLACEACHKNLDHVDFADAGSMPEMADCSTCHNNLNATLECASCHLNTLNLRPADHTADFLVTHKNVARMGDEDCVMCHTNDDCAECHEGANLLFTTSGSQSDVQTAFGISPTGTRGLVLPRVHDPNFRFTHGLQATGRTVECATCHETQSFCQTCHEAEGVDVAGKPLWHGGLDWGAIAGVVGTGGGRHAELARRDIESCAGCHDPQGTDPTCVLCHNDFDGVRGNNPKTHKTGFRNRFSEDSNFHSDDSAVCYACHTNTQQAGMGFCGYCHGPR